MEALKTLIQDMSPQRLQCMYRSKYEALLAYTKKMLAQKDIRMERKNLLYFCRVSD